MIAKFERYKLRIQILKSNRDNTLAAAAIAGTVPNATTGTHHTLPGTGSSKVPQRGSGNGQLQSQSNPDPLFRQGLAGLEMFELGGSHAFKLHQEDLSKGNQTKLEQEMEVFVREDRVRTSKPGNEPLCLRGFFLPSKGNCSCPRRHALALHWTPAQRTRFLKKVFGNNKKVGFYLSKTGKLAVSNR